MVPKTANKGDSEVTEPAVDRLMHKVNKHTVAVSYTHLDVYKRQIQHGFYVPSWEEDEYSYRN